MQATTIPSNLTLVLLVFHVNIEQLVKRTSNIRISSKPSKLPRRSIRSKRRVPTTVHKPDTVPTLSASNTATSIPLSKSNVDDALSDSSTLGQTGASTMGDNVADSTKGAGVSGLKDKSNDSQMDENPSVSPTNSETDDFATNGKVEESKFMRDKTDNMSDDSTNLEQSNDGFVSGFGNQNPTDSQSVDGEPEPMESQLDPKMQKLFALLEGDSQLSGSELLQKLINGDSFPDPKQLLVQMIGKNLISSPQLLAIIDPFLPTVYSKAKESRLFDQFDALSLLIENEVISIQQLLPILMQTTDPAQVISSLSSDTEQKLLSLSTNLNQVSSTHSGPKPNNSNDSINTSILDSQFGGNLHDKAETAEPELSVGPFGSLKSTNSELPPLESRPNQESKMEESTPDVDTIDLVKRQDMEPMDMIAPDMENMDMISNETAPVSELMERVNSGELNAEQLLFSAIENGLIPTSELMNSLKTSSIAPNYEVLDSTMEKLDIPMPELFNVLMSYNILDTGKLMELVSTTGIQAKDLMSSMRSTIPPEILMTALVATGLMSTAFMMKQFNVDKMLAKQARELFRNYAESGISFPGQKSLSRSKIARNTTRTTFHTEIPTIRSTTFLKSMATVTASIPSETSGPGKNTPTSSRPSETNILGKGTTAGSFSKYVSVTTLPTKFISPTLTSSGSVFLSPKTSRLSRPTFSSSTSKRLPIRTGSTSLKRRTSRRH